MSEITLKMLENIILLYQIYDFNEELLITKIDIIKKNVVE